MTPGPPSRLTKIKEVNAQR